MILSASHGRLHGLQFVPYIALTASLRESKFFIFLCERNERQGCCTHFTNKISSFKPFSDPNWEKLTFAQQNKQRVIIMMLIKKQMSAEAVLA